MKDYRVLFIVMFVALLSCKKEQISRTDIVGNWIEISSNADKVKLNLLENGSLYTHYIDTAGLLVIDTGDYVLTGQGSGIYFNFSWGSNGGNLILDDDEIEINDLYTDVFPTSTRFQRE